MKPWKTVMIGVAAASLVLGAGTFASANDSAADQRLESRIERRLQLNDAKLRVHDLKVDVEKGVATLTGKVKTEAEKLRVETLARIRGVSRVDSKLEVENKATRAPQTNVGEELSDGWITTKVKARFVGDDMLQGSDISVDTNSDGEVTLTGTVPSESARKHAVEVARSTKGVKKVNEQLKIEADR